MISSIQLSTGTRVIIPVFPQALGYRHISKSGGVVGDYNNNNGALGTAVYTLTDDEFIELGNILFNSNKTSVTKRVGLDTTPDSHYIATIAWYMSGANTFTLKTDVLLDTNSIRVDFGAYKGSATYRFYNGVNKDGDTWSDVETLFPNGAFNITSGGSYYNITGYYSGTFPASSFGGAEIAEATIAANVAAYIAANPESGVSVTETDYSNPYGINISGTGGGDGSGIDADIEDITKIAIPDVPSIDVNSSGFITTYNPSLAQLNALASFLWSNAFDLDTFKKLFSDPMQAIIGLGVVPVDPVASGAQTVKFGIVDTGVSMTKCKQYVQKSMGSVTIRKYIGSFLDYDPYVKIQIYLPYIGIRELAADDVMNDTVTVTYNIDVLTGGCAAIISTADKGVLYQFNGSCIMNIPLTSINFSQAIQNAVSAVGSVATTIVGAATGAAPIAAMGVAGLAANAANTAVNSKPTIQRSGSMGGSAGMMSVQRPYLIINRPKLSVPDKLNKFTGNTCNVTMKLNKCTGFTMVDYIHLSGIPAMEEEKKELDSILKKGVIF